MENGTPQKGGQWTSFNDGAEHQNGDDPLRRAGVTTKEASSSRKRAKHQSALLEPVELNELHSSPPPLDSPPSTTTHHTIPIPPLISPPPKKGPPPNRPPRGPTGKGTEEEEEGPNQKTDERSRRKEQNGDGEEMVDRDRDREVVLTVGGGGGGGRAGAETNGDEQQLKNGKLLVTVHPKSDNLFAWLRRPVYDARTVPPVLTNKQNQLTADVYSTIIHTIEKDARFVSYTLFYSRMMPCWAVFSVLVLLAVLASSPAGGLSVMIFAFVWLLMLILGLLFCALLQKYIVLALRNLMKEVNNISQTYRLLVGVMDRGILFIFYDFDGCREDIARQLRVQQANYPVTLVNNSQSDIEMAHKAEELMLEHAQAYAKGLLKLRLRFPTRPSEGVSDFLPRHVAKSHCLCQYVATEHFNKGPAKQKAPWYERFFGR